MTETILCTSALHEAEEQEYHLNQLQSQVELEYLYSEGSPQSCDNKLWVKVVAEDKRRDEEQKTKETG